MTSSARPVSAAARPTPTPVDVPVLADRLRDALGEVLAPAGGFGRLALLCPTGPLPDSVTTLVVQDPSGQPNAVVQCSAPRSSGADDLVRREVEHGRSARAALGPRLGDAVLEPLVVADDGERTYACYPLCRPLPSERWRWVAARQFVRRPLLSWLFEVVRTTRREPTPGELAADFVSPLEAVASDPRLSPALRAGARDALARLEARTWRPVHTVMHGDLWRGNVLRWPSRPWWRDRPPQVPLVVIDWRGSRPRGHAVIDLLRLTNSLRAGARVLRGELERHCWALGCELQDTRGYVLAGLGVASRNLGCVEPRQWVLGGESMWGQLVEALEL